jgi:Flp pilus assembly protein TadG
MKFIHRFGKTRRAAVAVIMAVSLAPLMFLIGIAVDYTFLSQDRTQTAFAAQAAATQATRVAAATYAFEVAQGNTNQTNAAKIAIDDANIAGNLWYNAELGTLTRGTTATPSTNTTYDGGTTGAVNTATPPNFAATVSDNTSYPPIFNPLFGRTSPWVYGSSATATSQFSYAQILLLLDTSGSMLIGADQGATGDIAKLENATVCPQQGTLISTDAGGNIPGGSPLNGGDYASASVDNDAVNFLNVSNYKNPKSATDQTEPCVTGGTNYGVSPSTYNGLGGSTAGTPCALACHFTTQVSSVTHNYADYYGLARYLGINLRLDVLFGATEQVIQDMQSGEAVANQLSVGVYNFNTDVFPIVTGSTGGGGTLPEATSDLASALSAVNAVDYKQNPLETSIPQLINGSTVSSVPSKSVANEGGDTDLPLSLQDLEAGNAVSQKNGKNQPLTATGDGSTPAKPLKFIFIVTDGMEDDSTGNGGPANSSPTGNVEGEMTSIAGEAANTGTCSYLKNSPTGSPAGLGYTVYVLYVDYYPVANGAYYTAPTPGGRYTNTNTNTDFPSDKNANIQTLTEVTSEAGQPNDAEYKDAPIAKALQACASSPSNFYEANSSASIQTALNQMLKSALASTIRLTN